MTHIVFVAGAVTAVVTPHLTKLCTHYCVVVFWVFVWLHEMMEVFFSSAMQGVAGLSGRVGRPRCGCRPAASTECGSGQECKDREAGIISAKFQ